MTTFKSLLVAGVIFFWAGAAQAGPIMPGLSWWLDAADSSTFVGTGPFGGVLTWDDKSSSGLNVTVASATRAVLTPNQLNGLPVVRFDGTNFYENNTGSPFDTGGQYTVFAVLGASRLATGEQEVIDTSPTGTTRDDVFLDSTGTNIFRGGGSAVSNGNYVTGDFLLASVWDGASSSLTLVQNDVATTTTGALNGAVSGAGTSIVLGAVNPNHSPFVASDFFSGDVAEILVYNGVLSSADFNSDVSYLDQKWGIPEPASLSLLMVGGVMVLSRRRASSR